ncbi:hypothetical protein JL721_1974 [Aureococcus anophagefferens]|nr:hypothetical protein JL721_1974 [Aureococcus anophagefferens]
MDGLQKQLERAMASQNYGEALVAVDALKRASTGGALVLDGALDDRLEDEASSWGDVDPETGEIIVMVKQKARSLEKAAAALAAEGDATNLDNVELVEKGTCSKGEWHQFLSYYDDETEPEADESSDLGEPAPFERVVRWRFDGIEMLLGSDTVVYSREGAAGAERVGVHVRDVGQRVTEVAALDMWLENTISGADDAAICYHKDGHVMGYQLVRTEDLPSARSATRLGGPGLDDTPPKRWAPPRNATPAPSARGSGARARTRASASRPSPFRAGGRPSRSATWPWPTPDPAAAAPAFAAPALVYALLAACADAASLDDHRGDLGDRPPKPRRFVAARAAPGGNQIFNPTSIGGEAPAPAPAADRPRRRRKDAPADGNDLRACAAALVALYTALGEHYLAVDRLTKAARHWSQGVELFRGLGDARSAAWLRARLAWAQLKLQDREGGAPTAAKRYAKTAALAAPRSAADAADEPESGGGAGVLPGRRHVGRPRGARRGAGRRRARGRAPRGGAPTPADAEALPRQRQRRGRGRRRRRRALPLRGARGAPRRRATVPADAVAHFRCRAGGGARPRRRRANALEALSMRVDLATVLLRDPDDAGRRALDVVLGAADALEIAAAAGRRRGGLRPAVCRALLDKLQTVLKLQVQKASLDQILAPPPDPAHLAAWKAAYAAALRMGADFDDDAPRLLALLRRTRDEAPTLAQDLA